MIKFEMDDRGRPVVEREYMEIMYLLFGHRHSHMKLHDRAKTLWYNFDTYLERFSYAHTIRTPHEVLFSCTRAAKL